MCFAPRSTRKKFNAKLIPDSVFLWLSNGLGGTLADSMLLNACLGRGVWSVLMGGPVVFVEELSYSDRLLDAIRGMCIVYVKVLESSVVVV